MFPARVLIKHKYKMTGDCYVMKFLQRLMWTENIWCVFRVKPPSFSNSSCVVWTGPIITCAVRTTYTIALSWCKITNPRKGETKLTPRQFRNKIKCIVLVILRGICIINIDIHVFFVTHFLGFKRKMKPSGISRWFKIFYTASFQCCI